MILTDILHALTPHTRPEPAEPPERSGARPPPGPPVTVPSLPRDPLWDRIEQMHREATQRLYVAERVYRAKAAVHGGDWDPA